MLMLTKPAILPFTHVLAICSCFYCTCSCGTLGSRASSLENAVMGIKDYRLSRTKQPRKKRNNVILNHDSFSTSQRTAEQCDDAPVFTPVPHIPSSPATPPSVCFPLHTHINKHAESSQQTPQQ